MHWRRPVSRRLPPPSAGELELALLADVQQLLDRWRSECAGRPEVERQRLLRLALEREQIVAVAYREEAVADRVRRLDIGDDARDLVRQALIWTWKDEQLHAEYLRGELLRTPGWSSRAVVYGRQLQGALSGWTSATSNLREARAMPLRTGAAGILVAAAGLTGQVPPVLRRELRYQTFRRYCQLNVALEASAELAYRRLVELSADPVERRTLDRIRSDEARHTVYAGRRVDYRSVIMMLLDAAPPDFSVVDGWAPVADGPFGVMGCHHPASVRVVYAGADTLSVDEAVLRDLGVDPRVSPIIRMAYHWFGLAVAPADVRGPRPDLHRELRGAHASRSLRALGLLSGPVYMYLSAAGRVFVPAIDLTAFPPLRPIGRATRAVQRIAQYAFGLRAPAAAGGRS